MGAPGAERYLVVDHKTNRLAPREEPLTAWHYRHDADRRLLRRLIPPLRLGGISLDLGFLILFIAVSIAMGITRGLA